MLLEEYHVISEKHLENVVKYLGINKVFIELINMI